MLVASLAFGTQHGVTVCASMRLVLVSSIRIMHVVHGQARKVYGMRAERDRAGKVSHGGVTLRWGHLTKVSHGGVTLLHGVHVLLLQRHTNGGKQVLDIQS